VATEKGTLMVVWLIRHGESQGNVGAVTHDYSSIPLTEAGEQQARDLARGLDEEPSLILFSNYLRARQTALPTIRRYPGVSALPAEVHEFNYLSHVRASGMTARERRPQFERYWRMMDPFYRDGDGAESFDDLRGRVQGLLAHVGSLPAQLGPVLVFTHGQYIQAVVHHLMRGEPETTTQELMASYRTFTEGFPVANSACIPLRRTGNTWTIGAPLVGFRALGTANPYT